MALLLVIWLLAELFLIVKVAEWIGVFWMFVLLVASWPLGLSIMRREGRAALARLSTAGASAHEPTEEVIEGVLVVVGGLLLMIPGFLTDFVGAVLLVRPTRRIAGKRVAQSARFAWLTRLANFVGGFGAGGGPRAGDGFGRRPPQDYDAESTAFDINDRHIDP